MKILKPTKISTISADTSNVNYPALNMIHHPLDGNQDWFAPGAPWKATATSAVITVGLSAGDDAACLIGTNCTALTWAVWNTTTTTQIETATPTIFSSRLGNSRLYWIDITAIPDDGDEYEIRLNVSGTATQQAEAVIKGAAHVFRAPKYGLRRRNNVMAITERGPGGSQYIKDVRRRVSYSGEVLCAWDATKGESELAALFDDIAPMPFVLLILDADYQRAIYCRAKDFSDQYDRPNAIMCSFSAEEI
jgi:hypothetical protein